MSQPRYPIRCLPPLVGLPALLWLPTVGCAGGHRQETEITGRFAVPADVRTLRVELRSGSATVLVDEAVAGEVLYTGQVMRGTATDSLWPRLEALSVELRGESAGGVLRLRAAELPDEIEPTAAAVVTKVVLRCPPGLRVVATTDRGHLRVAGATAGAELRTSVGDLSVARCHDAVLETGSGNILIDANSGPLRVDSGGGLVQAYVIAAVPVHVRARDGVQLHLPRDAAFELAAETPHGECVNAFGVPIVPLAAGGWQMRGTVKKGGPLVDLASGRGNVSVGVLD